MTGIKPSLFGKPEGSEAGQNIGYRVINARFAMRNDPRITDKGNSGKDKGYYRNGGVDD